MMGKMARLLEVMGSGPTTLSLLALKLDLEEQDVRGLLDIMVSLGYVRELTDECSGCARTLCGDCPVKASTGPIPRTYILTDKAP